MISSAKAWITERTREVARIGRETMGGDGILMDNYCIKALADAEVIYTYEVIIEYKYIREHMTLIVQLLEER